MTKEITLIDLIEERKSLIAQQTSMADTCEKESRQMNETEASEFETRKARIAELDAEIAKRKNTNTNNTTHMESRASLSRIIAAKVGRGTMTEADEKLLQRGADSHFEMSNGILLPVQKRAAITMGSYGSYGIQTEGNDHPVLAIENNLALVKAGARFISGLKGDLNIPVFGKASLAWKAETGSATDGTPSITQAKFTPHRLTGFFDISLRALIQENIDIESYLMDSIQNAVAENIDATALGKGASVANTPDGLFGGTLDDKGTLSWAKVVGLESMVGDGALGPNCAYIGHQVLIGKMKTTVKDASGAGAFVLNEGTGYTNGYKCIGSSNVASGLNVASSDNTGYGLAFGDWSKFIVAQFGSVELVTDSVSHIGDGLVRIYVNAFVDFKNTQPGAIKVAAYK